jgi:hypothetical protein
MLYAMLASAYTAALLVSHGAVAPQQRATGVRMGVNDMSSREARLEVPIGLAAGIALSQLYNEIADDLPGVDDAKEKARLRVVDEDAEDAMAKFFPGALGSSTVDHKTFDTLKKKGYTKANTVRAAGLEPAPFSLPSRPG